jgi:hypothetical protein
VRLRRLTGQEERIGGFDLVYRGGPLPTTANRQFSTYLGTVAQNLQRMQCSLHEPCSMQRAPSFKPAPGCFATAGISPPRLS